MGTASFCTWWTMGTCSLILGPRGGSRHAGDEGRGHGLSRETVQRGCDRLPSAASCREQQLLLKSFNRFDQLAKRVQPLGFLPNAIPHEVVPIPIEVGAAHVQHRLSTLDGPAHP